METKPATRRARINTKDLNTFQKIQLYYKEEQGRVVLTPTEDKIRQRWEMAYKKLGKWNTKKEVANELSKIFGISHHQAMLDIRAAEMFFKKELEVDVEIERGRLMEALRKGMKLAMKKKDPYAIEKISNAIIKATGMDKEIAKPLIDPAKIKPHTINLSTDPDILKAEADRLRREAMEMEAEDIEYEETN
jgi:hypothetical protein